MWGSRGTACSGLMTGRLCAARKKGVYGMENVIGTAAELGMASIIWRLLLAMVIGSVVGMERSSRGRGAGVKTHTLVCVGAALVMLTSQFIWGAYGHSGDPARLGAQVISGIGFLGAGTIMVTGRNHVKGLTTAAGLWVCACEGLAVGIGFWEGALVTLVVILFTLRVLVKVDSRIHRHAKNFELYIEFNGGEDVRRFMQDIKLNNLGRIVSIDVTKSRISGSGQAALIGFEMWQGKRRPDLVEWIHHREYVLYLEEI